MEFFRCIYNLLTRNYDKKLDFSPLSGGVGMIDNSLERLRTAQIAIAALIVHDNMALHKTFKIIELEIARRLDGSNAETLAKARALLEGQETGESGETGETGETGDQAALLPAPSASEGATSCVASDLLSTREAAALLGERPAWLDSDRHYAKKKGGKPRVPYVIINNRVFYRREDVERARQAGEGTTATLSRNGEELLTSEQAAAVLGITPRQLENNRHYAKTRGADLLVPFVKSRGKILYHRASVEKVMLKCPPQLRRFRAAAERAQVRPVQVSAPGA